MASTQSSIPDHSGSTLNSIPDPSTLTHDSTSGPSTFSQRSILELPIELALERLGTTEQGLSPDEAKDRLKKFGPNELPESTHRPLWLRFADQLTHFMALLLWVAGALAFYAQIAPMGIAIWSVVLINAGFSFWQEYRAEKALLALKNVLPKMVKVRRAGELILIPASQLVRGDIFEIEEGDSIPADARLIWSESLYVDISVMTGESVPVLRTADPVEGRKLLPVRGGKVIEHIGEHSRHEVIHPSEVPNFILAGTCVTSGRGTAAVYATGAQTEFGHIARLTVSVKREPSSLELQVARIVRIISSIAVLMGAIVFLLSYLFVGMSATASFIFAIGIIVANVPEGLLPTVTLSLALSVQKMAKENALVRRLSAVEDLSATTVICTDKTGTLTKNEMTVRYLRIFGSEEAQSVIEVTGAGYDPTIGCINYPTDHDRSWVAELLIAGATLCSNARLLKTSDLGTWKEIGDPTEAALLVVAKKARLDLSELRQRFPRLREVPFDSNRRMMTVVVRQSETYLWENGGSETPRELGITKGAPLEVLRHCVSVLKNGNVVPLDEGLRDLIISENDRFAKDGLRVIGLAARLGGNALGHLTNLELEQNLVFVGLIAMYDPPRPEVKDAIAKCHEAGIKVSMVTGDYGLTADAIARNIGLIRGQSRVITGEALTQMSRAQLQQLLKYRSGLVFARMSPEHKLFLVNAYKEIGEVVAVTGDGVNDAPALRAAHVGFAMGIQGTDVAREAADIVLTDDNFASIVSAIKHGRAVYQNIRKFMTYILSSNIPEIVPFLAMVGLKIPPALSIMQILAVDLVTDMAPAVALGAEGPDEGSMKIPPRKKEEYLLNKRLLVRAYLFLGTIEGLFAMAAFFFVWQINGYTLSDMQAVTPGILSGTADPNVMAVFLQATTLTLTTIVACQIGNVLACRSESDSVALSFKNRNRLLIYGISVELAALAAITYLAPFNRIFSTTSLPIELLFILPICPLAIVGADELRKAYQRKRSAVLS